MPAWVWIVLAIVVGFAVLLVLARRAAVTGVDPTRVTLSPEVAARAKELAVQGRKIEAMKLVRGSTGMPLAAAKLVVDRMAAQRPS